ncbi:hypothetical protein FRC00_006749 [Tulasnella sp. 408]|nr:hypothetical protein FRC00_006749 [Tulasnella sp. 408]
MGAKTCTRRLSIPLEINESFRLLMVAETHDASVSSLQLRSAARYIEGQMSHDEQILTTLIACNVAFRMQPIQDHPFNARSFFTRAEVKDMGRSVELWRGFFQSVRPVIGKMVINVDTSSAAFYKSGPLIKVCLEYLGRSPEADPTQVLSASRLDARTRRDLLKFIRNLNVRTQRGVETRIRAIRDISEKGADTLLIRADNGGTVPLPPRLRTGKLLPRLPNLQALLLNCLVSKLSAAAWVPLECCDVVPGQFYRKTLTPDQTKHMVEFSTPRPDARLRNIRNGLQQLSYGNSPYLQDFGINVDPNPITIKCRILPTPTLLYGQNVTIQPRDGRWNMRHKTLYKPEKITGCAIIVYDQRFGSRQEEHLKRSLFYTTRNLGIQGMPPDPPVLRKDAGGGAYWKAKVAIVHKAAKGNMPNLIIAVLPEFGWEDIYLRVKK